MDWSGTGAGGGRGCSSGLRPLPPHLSCSRRVLYDLAPVLSHVRAGSWSTRPQSCRDMAGRGGRRGRRESWLADTHSPSCVPVFGSDGKESARSAGDPGSIPGLGRFPGEGNGNPFNYSCPENPMDGGAWSAAVHGVAKSQTRLSDLCLSLRPHVARQPWRGGWKTRTTRGLGLGVWESRCLNGRKVHGRDTSGGKARG